MFCFNWFIYSLCKYLAASSNYNKQQMNFDLQRIVVPLVITDDNQNWIAEEDHQGHGHGIVCNNVRSAHIISHNDNTWTWADGNNSNNIRGKNNIEKNIPSAARGASNAPCFILLLPHIFFFSFLFFFFCKHTRVSHFRYNHFIYFL